MINRDELIARMLDGTIEEADIPVIREEMARAPEFAAEISDLTRIDRLLRFKAYLESESPDLVVGVLMRLDLGDQKPEAFQASVNRTIGRRESGRFAKIIRFVVAPLALAASLAIVAGVYWSRPAAGLGLRVAEVRGRAVIGYRLSVIGDSVTASPSHQVTGSKATSYKLLKIGDVLRPGDGVEVGADGFVKLAYLDGTQVELQHDSRLRVTLGAGAEKDAKRLALDGGKFVCSAAPQKKPFEIKTPHAIARVVGTRFSLDVTDPKTVLAVTEGTVALIQGDKILLVNAGETTVATEKGLALVTGTTGTEPQTGTPVSTIILGDERVGEAMLLRLWWNPSDMTLEGEKSPIHSGASFLFRWNLTGPTGGPVYFLGQTSVGNTKHLIRLADGRLLGLDAPWTSGDPLPECAPVELQPNVRRFGPAVTLESSSIGMTACDRQGRYFMAAVKKSGAQAKGGRVVMWDLQRGVLAADLTTLPTTPHKMGDFGFVACAVAPDAGLGVVVDSGGGMLVLDLPAGAVRHRLALPMPQHPQAYGLDLAWEQGELVCRGWPSLAETIRVDPAAGVILERFDHPVIRHGDKTIHVRANEIEAVRQGTAARRISMPQVKMGTRLASVMTVAAGWRCSPDGRWLVGTPMTGTEQVLVDLQEGRCVSPQAESKSQRAGVRRSSR